MKSPVVRIVVPADVIGEGIGCGQGTKVFINGIEFKNLKHIKYGEEVSLEEVRTSKLALTFYGDILVERDNA
jgi:hypothetical protein